MQEIGNLLMTPNTNRTASKSGVSTQVKIGKPTEIYPHWTINKITMGGFSNGESIYIHDQALPVWNLICRIIWISCPRQVGN
jgi:hypothetical protein